MHITKDRLRELVNENFPVLGCVIDDDDIPCLFDFVSEILDQEAKLLEIKEPYATTTISRLEAAAYEVFNLGREIEEITG